MDGVRNDALPYGVDTLVLRIEWPATARPSEYNGRMWRMRPLGGWTPRLEVLQDVSEPGQRISQPANESVEHSRLQSVGLEAIGTLSDQSVDGGAILQIQFAIGRNGPVAFPPVFLPGTPENEDFVRSTLEGLEAAREPSGLSFMPRNPMSRQS